MACQFNSISNGAATFSSNILPPVTPVTSFTPNDINAISATSGPQGGTATASGSGTNTDGPFGWISIKQQPPSTLPPHQRTQPPVPPLQPPPNGNSTGTHSGARSGPPNGPYSNTTFNGTSTPQNISSGPSGPSGSPSNPPPNTLNTSNITNGLNPLSSAATGHGASDSTGHGPGASEEEKETNSNLNPMNSINSNQIPSQNETENNNASNQINCKLQELIVSILKTTQNGAKRECLKHCRVLEEMVSEYEHQYTRLSVNERLRLAQSYFLLGSKYREQNCRNSAYSFVEKSLTTFRDCNGLALAAGYSTETKSMEGGLFDVSEEDVGHFWPQIVEVYILGGHILLQNRQYADAKIMYQSAHNLALFIKTTSRKAQLTVSETLENLAVVSMYDNKVWFESMRLRAMT